MSDPKLNRAAVRHTKFKGKPAAQCLALAENVCTTAAQCAEVQASPVAAPAFAALQGALAAAQASYSNKVALAQALLTAIKSVHGDIRKLKASLGTYESAVGGLAGGNAILINKAGLKFLGKKRFSLDGGHHKGLR